MKRSLVTTSEPDAAKAEGLRVAGADMQQLARDIAAEGVSPTHLRRRRSRTRHDREEPVHE
jgi:hypothetical protein